MLRRRLQLNLKTHRPGEVRAFTLVELITVVSILAVLLAVTVPSVSSMWTQRNESAAANILRGLLISARSQAIRNGERGLFFYVDRKGVQRVVFIEADPPGLIGASQDTGDCIEAGENNNCIAGAVAVTVNRFRVMSGKVYTIPTPYRVAPMWTLALANSAVPAYQNQLANEIFFQASGNVTPYYHRNYFTVIFGSDGQLLVNRDVLIHDATRSSDFFSPGDQTRLTVGREVDEAWVSETTASNVRLDLGSFVDIGRPGSNDKLFDIIILDDGRAANFMSVDGLLVYDDSKIEDLAPLERGQMLKQILLEQAQPFYVSRYTGSIVRGRVNDE